MRILTKDNTDGCFAVYTIKDAENGVTSIDFDNIGIQNASVTVPNAILFYTTDDEFIYLIIEKDYGDELLCDLFDEQKLDLTGYDDYMLFFPSNQKDMENLNVILKKYYSERI